MSSPKPTEPPEPTALERVRMRMHQAARDAGRSPPRLLAVSKTQSATAIAELAAALRPGLADGSLPAFGENYVQEALGKQRELAGLALEWHLIGHLQSNKARDAADAFDWVQTVDRPKLVEVLAAHRDAARPPLNVLIQVNIDDEASKHGCRPEDIDGLAATIAAKPGLALRGLMAIPAPDPDFERRRAAFRRMREWFEALRARYPGVDTLSMGMSDDFPLAVAEGATMIRVGSALFGPRPPPREHASA